MFLTIYLVLIITFFIFVGACLVAAPSLFSMMKRGGLKESYKFIIKIAALVMLAFVTIIQLPMFVTIF